MEKSFLKFNEEIKTKNFSELDNWNIKNNDNRTYNGTKNLNPIIGDKVIDLLDEYAICVTSCGIGNWLNDHKLLIGKESLFLEYRVHLGKVISWKDYLDYEISGDFDELSEDEQQELKNDYEKYKINNDTNAEFSVFLPSNLKNKSESEIIRYALSDASNYLKLLNESIPEAINSYFKYDVFGTNTKETVDFINKNNIEITNKNLDSVVTISYRLYKDNKFFKQFEEEFGSDTRKLLFNKWLKLL